MFTMYQNNIYIIITAAILLLYLLNNNNTYQQITVTMIAATAAMIPSTRISPPTAIPASLEHVRDDPDDIIITVILTEFHC